MSGPLPRIVRLVRPLGRVPSVYELCGSSRPRSLFAFFEGNPQRSGGAAGVPSPVPPHRAIPDDMASSDEKHTNGIPAHVEYGVRKPPASVWVQKRVINKNAGRQAMSKREAKPRRWWSRDPRDPRKKQTVEVTYLGGPECWYRIVARGLEGNFPGYVALHDAMEEINRGKAWYIADEPWRRIAPPDA